jgi:MYXO-CTERM domain-containing protein
VNGDADDLGGPSSACSTSAAGRGPGAGAWLAIGVAGLALARRRKLAGDAG